MRWLRRALGGANRRRVRVPVEPGPRRGRILVLAVVGSLAFAALLTRAWWLQIVSQDRYTQQAESNALTRETYRGPRGDIRDRNGNDLAISVMLPSLCANPRMVSNPVAVAARLAELTGTPKAVLERRLTSGRAFAWISRDADEPTVRAVMALGVRGIDTCDEPRRFYPSRSLAGQVLGFVGRDGAGLEGVERDFESTLRGGEIQVEAMRDRDGRRALIGGAVNLDDISGHSITLTLDSLIQGVAERALAEQVAEMDAASGLAVVLDPRTGELLALAQTPSFDPNAFGDAQVSDWRNRVLTDTFEPGSTIKPLLIAAALDQERTTPDTIWPGNYGRIQVGKHVISDVHGVKELTTLEIIQRSSNVGAVQVAQRLGREMWHGYLRAFGVGEASGLGLVGEQTGVLGHYKDWRQIHLATRSYGYGLSMNALQMARAVGAIANGGLMMRLRLVREIRDVRGRLVERFEPQVERKVLGAYAARETTRGMVMVTQKGGTGRNARVPGFTVAGKTGTARKVEPGGRGYSKSKVTSSFVGFVPAEDPRLLVYVVIDEPRAASYGGIVAAPVFTAVAREALPYLGVQPAEGALDAAVEEEDDAEEVEPLEPQARPWWFEEATLVGAPSHLVVPDLRGRSLGEVLQVAREMRLDLAIEGAGLVARQRPRAGALLPADARVTVELEQPGRLAGGEHTP